MHLAWFSDVGGHQQNICAAWHPAALIEFAEQCYLPLSFFGTVYAQEWTISFSYKAES